MKQNFSFQEFAVLCSYAVVAMIASATTMAGAATLTVDAGNVATYPTLSSAVNFVQAADDGPHTINYEVDTLTAADPLEVYITEQMTINGDADANGTALDILVDLSALKTILVADSAGHNAKSYIEIRLGGNGTVTINDLKIHPNVNGNPNQEDAQYWIAGIRTLRPPNNTHAEYILQNVCVSGSSGSNYVSLETDDDIYSSTGRKWTSTKKNSGNDQPLVHVANFGGQGTYDTVLDHCQAGLAFGAALIVDNIHGATEIAGGLYGHCGRDAIHVEGTNVTIRGQGEHDRLRIIRSTNVSGGDSHALEIAGAQVDLIEYVDILGHNTSNLIKLSAAGSVATVTTLRNCRLMGKVAATPAEIKNQCFFAEGNSDITNPITGCTFVGNGTAPTPLWTTTSFAGHLVFQDCIFTSEGNAAISINGGTVDFVNCALPTAGTGINEKLASVPVVGTGTFSLTSIVDQTPNYELVASDYVWSDTSNPDVLRPKNRPYYTAVTLDGISNLVGGAGGTEVPVTVTAFSLE